jgi:hypothetical protein
MSRYVDLPLIPYCDLSTREQSHVQTYLRHLKGWIEYVSSPQRDAEVGFGLPYPPEIPHLYASETCLIQPLLQEHVSETQDTKRAVPTVPVAPVDVILVDIRNDKLPPNYEVDTDQDGVPENMRRLRRRVDTCGRTNLKSGCGHCDAVVSDLAQNSDGTVTCTKCGHISSRALTGLENPLWSIPFAHGTRTRQQKQSYEMTRNFAKVLLQLQGRDASKATKDVIELCRQRIYPNQRVNQSTIRIILNRHNLPEYYPCIPSILLHLGYTDCVVDLHGRDDEVIAMHLQYVTAFEQCPSSVRSRRTSLRNNFLCRMFFLMLNMPENVRRVPTLEGEEKRRSHERVFRWIVEWVRENLIPEDVDPDDTPWRWVTPVYD